MTDSVLQVNTLLTRDDDIAVAIDQMWTTYRNQMAGIRDKWAEIDAYIFATDTRTTSNNAADWKNSTTLPKICQIRDNLHSNYISALFPNESWLSWKAHSKDAARAKVAKNITGYMANKLRQSHFRNTASRLALDYIDKGNCFVMSTFERRYMNKEGERVADYVGPKAMRISPYDIVFDPTASDFAYTPKIVRSLHKIGDLIKLARTHESHQFWETVIEQRRAALQLMSGLSIADQEKINQYHIDGFGSLQEYFGSQVVEVLDFYGDYYNTITGEFQEARHITIADRKTVVRNEPIATYSGRAPIFTAGWRLRPDNLWAMSPLENLIGLQYRLDHLENLAADATDFTVHPMLKVIGEVEQFDYAPGGTIIIDEGGSDVKPLEHNMASIATAESKMQIIEDRMELYAGAPREAMGIRSPGEKTAFEFGSLQSAAGRIFTEKTTNLEVECFEPLLNSMLETSHRNFESVEVVPTVDDELGIELFDEISKDDLTANGVLQPVGARHFAQEQQDLVSLNQALQGPIGEKVAPHLSGMEMSRLLDNVLDLRGYKLFGENVAVLEAQETERLMQAAKEDLQVEQEGPIAGEDDSNVEPEPTEGVEL